MNKIKRLFTFDEETDKQLNELRFLLQEVDKSKIIRTLISKAYEQAKKAKE